MARDQTNADGIQVVDLELFPGVQLHVAIYHDLAPGVARHLLETFFPEKAEASAEAGEKAASANGTKRKLDDSTEGAGEGGKSDEAKPEAAPPLQAALVDGSLVFSEAHVAVAALNAWHRRQCKDQTGRSGLRTRGGLPAELLLCLSAGRGIDAALRNFGLKAATRILLVCSFEGPAPVRQVQLEIQKATPEPAAAASSPQAAAPTTWEAHSAAAAARAPCFFKHFKLTKDEVARVQGREPGRKQQESGGKGGGGSGGKGAAAAASASGARVVCDVGELEKAVLSRVAIQGHERD